MMIWTAAIFFAASTVTSATPVGTENQGKVASVEASPDEGTAKIICKRERAPGSRLSAKKVCQTAAEWERQRREDQQMAEKVQSSRWKSN